MFRTNLLNRGRGRGVQRAATDSFPAPVGGWNARDPLAAMSPKDAVILENWFPKANDVELRPGASLWVHGFGKPVRTVMAWNGPSSSKMFAATDDGIYEASTEMLAGVRESSLTAGRMSYVNFQVAGGQYLVAVNGSDKLKLYDGTTWADIDSGSTPAITGLSTTQLDFVAVAVRRLWFVQKDSTSAWYLPVAQIGGALAEFPLGSIFGKGGKLVAIDTWTIDGGDGVDDYTVFASSEGEVVIYKGIDPGSSTTFSKVGTYYIGEPIGRNCFCKYGGDLLLLSQNGLFPMSRAMQSASIDRSVALTSKIDSAFAEAVSLYGNNEGWQAIAYPQGNILIVNIPITSTTAQQYVMNTVTKAWCKFTGWNATNWITWNKQVYFGAANFVAKAWTGSSDFDMPIVGKAQQAYSYFGQRGREKHGKLVRPVITYTGDIEIAVSLDTDFSLNPFPSFTSFSSVIRARWDSAIWDRAVWGGGTTTQKAWLSFFANPFYAAALRLQISSKSSNLRWSATDFVVEIGGVL